MATKGDEITCAAAEQTSVGSSVFLAQGAAKTSSFLVDV